MDSISAEGRREIIDALRRGTVPQRWLDVFAVGVERFELALDSELSRVAEGSACFKAVRGEYGSGKTFFGRWLQERAKRRQFTTAEVQISETETPLHRLETVYRRAMERLSTAACRQGAFRPVIDLWLDDLQEETLSAQRAKKQTADELEAKSARLMEQRLAGVSKHTPQFAIALRAYRQAQVMNDTAAADGLIAWLAGQPHIGASVKRPAGLKGDVDHFAALSFLQGLLTVLRDSSYAGLLLVLDEIETLQRVRGDVREKALNALRQFVDEIEAGRFPGLYLLITGTPAFFEGPHGVRRLEPMAQRLHVDFKTDARFDNLRAVQIRLPGFSHNRLVEVGIKIRDLYAEDANAPKRIRTRADDSYIDELARVVTGDLGGKVGVAPRLFLKKLVDVLDRIDQYKDFDPRRQYSMTVAEQELTRVEREAKGLSVDNVELEM